MSRSPTPDCQDRFYVGGYLEELAAHQLAAGPFPPSLQDVQIVNAAAKLLQSETRPTPLPADANGKRPRLFYFEETENCWCPAEGLEVENIISADNFLSNGEIVEIQFKREDMTDAEFDAIPEG